MPQSKEIEPEGHYKVIYPLQLSYISYPAEWSFEMLKSAALLTLNIQKLALQKGMTLKDASAYNIQFYEGKPILIDTLSFEKYEAGQAWQAYKQFCEHFLAPLALATYQLQDLQKLLIYFTDGIPLHLAARILPFKAYFNTGLLIHLFFHAKIQKQYNNSKVKTNSSKFTIQYLIELTENLIDSVHSLSQHKKNTWVKYYDIDTAESYLKEKKEALLVLIHQIKTGKIAADIGANTGLFSRIIAQHFSHTFAIEQDYESVNEIYLQVKKENITNISPIWADILSPTPAFGWANTERTALFERYQPDTIFLLAVIHHLTISKNIPFEKIAAWVAGTHAKNVIVEFIPKTDPQVQRLLQNRTDIFDKYTANALETAFLNQKFRCLDNLLLPVSNRRLYLFVKKS